MRASLYMGRCHYMEQLIPVLGSWGWSPVCGPHRVRPYLGSSGWGEGGNNVWVGTLDSLVQDSTGWGSVPTVHCLNCQPTEEQTLGPWYNFVQMFYLSIHKWTEFFFTHVYMYYSQHCCFAVMKRRQLIQRIIIIYTIHPYNIKIQGHAPFLLCSCSGPGENLWWHAIKFCVHGVRDATQCPDKQAVTVRREAANSDGLGTGERLRTQYETFHIMVKSLSSGEKLRTQNFHITVESTDPLFMVNLNMS